VNNRWGRQALKSSVAPATKQTALDQPRMDSREQARIRRSIPANQQVIWFIYGTEILKAGIPADFGVI
jgi:hypothetical protein